ncbi:MAG: LysR family transcriptional regulator [Myxococcales bacterium]|nr:LysR family transcriptional regulator [Myxococcales bacterium]
MLERVLARQSVADAASDLGLSPSATSRALQRLRDTLGDPLLVRAGNTLVPTERARELLGPVSTAVEAARLVFDTPKTFDPATASGSLAIALGPELQEAWLPAIARRLWELAPGVDLRLHDLLPHCVELARRDRLQLAVVPDLSGILPTAALPDLGDIVREPLYTRRFVGVGAPEAWTCRPDLASWCAAEHVIMASDGADRGFVDDLLDARGLSRRVACSVTTFGAVLAVVRRTRMLAAVPAEILPSMAPDLIAFEPPFAVPSMRIDLMWHHRHTTQPRHRALRRCIAETVRSLTTPGAPAGAP